MKTTFKILLLVAAMALIIVASVYTIVYLPYMSLDAKLQQHEDSLVQIRDLHQEIATVYWNKAKTYPAPEASKEYVLWFRHSMKVDSLDQLIGEISLDRKLKELEEHNFIQK